MVIILYIITMEVVKAFNANELHTEIIIKGTFEEPLFRASDIGVVLELSNINSIIRDFDESEKDEVLTIDAIGRQQNPKRVCIVCIPLAETNKIRKR